MRPCHCGIRAASWPNFSASGRLESDRERGQGGVAPACRCAHERLAPRAEFHRRLYPSTQSAQVHPALRTAQVTGPLASNRCPGAIGWLESVARVPPAHGRRKSACAHAAPPLPVAGPAALACRGHRRQSRHRRGLSGRPSELGVATARSRKVHELRFLEVTVWQPRWSRRRARPLHCGTRGDEDTARTGDDCVIKCPLSPVARW